MANKLVLTQIMKNEAHVAERMLNSIKGFVDGICIIDTGSTDNSIEIVKNWGARNNIETYVFERPFDNFEASRNFSIEKAREVFLNRQDGNKYYGFWLDFDEELIIDSKFKKESIDKDFYMFNTRIGAMQYTRNEMFNLSLPFRWYGVVHEFLVIDQDVTSGVLDGVLVNVHTDGGSWQGDVSAKYLSHAHELEKYLAKDRTDPRWIFYAGQSYFDSANTGNKIEDDERLRRSMKYYQERYERIDGYYEERYFALYRVCSIMRRLEYPVKEIVEVAKKAYALEPTRIESFKEIIDLYFTQGQYNLAYIYSKMAYEAYHGKVPNKLLFVDTALYNWRLADSHAGICLYTGRAEEARIAYKKVEYLMNKNPQMFTENEINNIKLNGKNFR